MFCGCDAALEAAMFGESTRDGDDRIPPRTVKSISSNPVPGWSIGLVTRAPRTLYLVPLCCPSRVLELIVN